MSALLVMSGKISQVTYNGRTYRMNALLLLSGKIRQVTHNGGKLSVRIIVPRPASPKLALAQR